MAVVQDETDVLGVPVLVTTAASPGVVNDLKPRRGSRLATAAQSSGAVVATTSGADHLTGDLTVWGTCPVSRCSFHSKPAAETGRKAGYPRTTSTVRWT